MKFAYFKDEKNRKVIAVHYYGGRPIKGVATCNPEDEFDMEKGKTLATVRCKRKVAKAKNRVASQKLIEASNELERAARRYEKMKQYYIDTVDLKDEAEAEIADLLNTF